MMSDSRAFDGWRRLSRAVMVEVSNDDPAGLAQVKQHIDELDGVFTHAVAIMAGVHCEPGCSHVHYSHGEIARALGVTRQAVSKRVRAVVSVKPRGAMPAGSGGVRCLDCSATAAADGTGRPIVLRHADECPNRR